jgi:hypothetical protein
MRLPFVNTLAPDETNKIFFREKPIAARNHIPAVSFLCSYCYSFRALLLTRCLSLICKGWFLKLFHGISFTYSKVF